MDIGAMTRWGTILIFNNSGATLSRGDVVSLDPDSWESVPQADAIISEPYDSPTAAILPTFDLITTGTDQLISGVVQNQILDNTAGQILCFGVTLARVTPTTTLASGQAYIASGTAGELDDALSAPVATGAPTLAIQGGTSGTTSPNSLRLVFYHGIWGMAPAAADTANPLGGA